MSVKLRCSQKRQKRDTAKETALDQKKAVARINARRQAVAAAEKAAFDFAEWFMCPEGCPNMKITIRIGKPVKHPCLPTQLGGGQGFECSASCTWSVVVKCRRAPLPKDDEDMEVQELGCNIDEEAYAGGWVRGFGLDLNEKKSRKVAEEKALDSAHKAVMNAIHQVSCSPDCPTKVVTVLLSSPETACQNPALAAAAAIGVPPPPGSKYDCTSNVRWAVWVSCS